MSARLQVLFLIADFRGALVLFRSPILASFVRLFAIPGGRLRVITLGDISATRVRVVDNALAFGLVLYLRDHFLGRRLSKPKGMPRWTTPLSQHSIHGTILCLVISTSSFSADKTRTSSSFRSCRYLAFSLTSFAPGSNTRDR